MRRIYIDYLTACRWWLQPGSEVALSRSPHFADRLSGVACNKRDMQQLDLSCLNGMEYPLHVAIPNVQMRRKNDDLVFHRVEHRLPRRAYLRLSDEVYIASPELTLLHMPSVLNKYQLLYLADLFCARYTLDEAGDISARANCVTTPAKLQRLVSSVSNCHGIVQAQKVFPLCTAGAESPREIGLAMRVCAPRRMGGRGVDGAILNKRIPLNKQLARMAGKSEYRCDLFYPGYNVALEYYGSEWHSGLNQMARDAIRRNLLEHRGIRVIEITGNQYNSEPGFDNVIRQLCKALNRRYRKLTPAQIERARELQRALDLPWDVGLR